MVSNLNLLSTLPEPYYILGFPAGFGSNAVLLKKAVVHVVVARWNVGKNVLSAIDAWIYISSANGVHLPVEGHPSLLWFRFAAIFNLRKTIAMRMVLSSLRLDPHRLPLSAPPLLLQNFILSHFHNLIWNRSTFQRVLSRRLDFQYLVFPISPRRTSHPISHRIMFLSIVHLIHPKLHVATP